MKNNGLTVEDTIDQDYVVYAFRFPLPEDVNSVPTGYAKECDGTACFTSKCPAPNGFHHLAELGFVCEKHWYAIGRVSWLDLACNREHGEYQYHKYFNGGWIHVNDELPPHDEQVLVMTAKGRMLIGLYRDDLKEWCNYERWEHNEDFPFLEDVAFWRSLPEPPVTIEGRY